MTKEALKLALEALDVVKLQYTQNRHVNEAITAIKEALAQPVQEPVGWVSEDVCEGQYIDGRPRKIWWECSKGVGTAFYTTPPLPEQERNFCQRCGKRTADLTTIHTCTPPQEALYGMNQDDWKDVVAAISKVRDGRGIYLACRPADVFKDWFLALGTAKVKEKK